MSYDKKCHKVHVLWTFCVNGLKALGTPGFIVKIQTNGIVIILNEFEILVAGFLKLGDEF